MTNVHSQNERCKKMLSRNELSSENLSVAIFSSIILDLWYYDCDVIEGENGNTKFFQKTSSKECSIMAVEKTSE